MKPPVSQATSRVPTAGARSSSCSITTASDSVRKFSSCRVAHLCRRRNRFGPLGSTVETTPTRSSPAACC